MKVSSSTSFLLDAYEGLVKRLNSRNYMQQTVQFECVRDRIAIPARTNRICVVVNLCRPLPRTGIFEQRARVADGSSIP